METSSSFRHIGNVGALAIAGIWLGLWALFLTVRGVFNGFMQFGMNDYFEALKTIAINLSIAAICAYGSWYSFKQIRKGKAEANSRGTAFVLALALIILGLILLRVYTLSHL